MKKFLLIFVSIIAVLVTGAVLVFVLNYTGTIDITHNHVVNPVKVYYTEDGHMYTESKWQWTPAESKEVIEYVPAGMTGTKNLSLLLHDTTYCDITVPDVPCIYDYGKTVWAEDGSFMIRVIGDANIDNLSSLAGIDNGENINQYSLRNADGKKGARVLATLVGDYAIIANVYSGDDEYSILYNSISRDIKPYEVTSVPYAKSLKKLQSVSYDGNFAQSITADSNSIILESYKFQDGSIRYRNVPESFSDACNEYLIQIAKFSRSGQIEEEYLTDNVLYARSGEYYLLVIKKTSNMCFVMVGHGEEANCNIVFNMMQLVG